MKSLIMYQLEGIQDENAVSKIFEKHCPSETEKMGSCLFLEANKAPDFCRLIGFYSANNTQELEQIAELMSQSDYEKKMEKFNLKAGKMNSKVINAKKSAVKTKAETGVNGKLNGTSVDKLLNAAEQLQKEINENPKVIKAQDKLGNFLDKNKIYRESSQYVTGTKNNDGAISWTCGMESKNIFETIETVKNPKPDYIETVLKQLKEFLEELLKVSKKVGLMSITDGDKTMTQISKKSIKLNQLTASDLMDSKNREIIYVTK